MLTIGKWISIFAVSVGVVAEVPGADSKVNFYSLQGTGNPNSPTGVVRDFANAPLSGSRFVAQLWGGLNSDPCTFTIISDIYSFTSNYELGGASYGQIVDEAYPVPGGAQGDRFFYVVRAWDITAGAQFFQARQFGLAAESQIASLILTADSDVPPNTDNFWSFAMIPQPPQCVVPEPSQYGLIGVGCLLWLLGIKSRRLNSGLRE